MYGYKNYYDSFLSLDSCVDRYVSFYLMHVLIGGCFSARINRL